jgi:hypothetical protein
MGRTSVGRLSETSSTISLSRRSSSSECAARAVPARGIEDDEREREPQMPHAEDEHGA